VGEAPLKLKTFYLRFSSDADIVRLTNARIIIIIIIIIKYWTSNKMAN